MTRRAWFCYEEGFNAKPVPVIYYDELPTSSVSGKENVKKRLQVVEITNTVVEDGETAYSFATLQKLFPYISQQEKKAVDNTTEVVVNSKKQEKKMTARQVYGYLTPQGKFFEHKTEADLYEARYELNKVTTDAVVKLGVEGEENISKAVDAVISFLNQHHGLVKEYLRARAAAGEYEEAYAVDGSTTTSDSEDDSPVWDGVSVEMDVPSTTEADTSSTGEDTEQTTE